MTMMFISYIATWLNIMYALITAPTDVELWGEEIE
ncbi:hypothetical protein BSGG_5277 [Bacteroides sp. D2]|nr:hypothetical protein BSGG_5277 [Bacteroides sp. D2]